ncbi:MAG: sulfatase/phosphatase domain-containing protein [Spirochaetota bacterium]
MQMLGSHMMYQKMCMYEPSVRTPLAWKLPAYLDISPRSVDALVSAIDALPTICELVDEEAPDEIDGQSLVALMRGEPGGWARAFIQFDGNGARGNLQRAVVEGGYKLIVDIFKDEQFLELYNVAEDPEETTSLAFDTGQRERLNRLVGYVLDHMAGTVDLLALRENTVESFLNDYGPVRPPSRG